MTILEAARMFPSLAAALSGENESEATALAFLRAQRQGDGGSGRKAAAAFLLSMFDSASVDMGHAWSVWDSAHRDAAIAVLRGTDSGAS